MKRIFGLSIILGILFCSLASATTIGDIPKPPAAVGGRVKTVQEVLEKKSVYLDEEVTQKKGNGPVVAPFQCGGLHRPVRIAGFVNYPPFGWMEITKQAGEKIVDQRYDGIGYALFMKIAKERNLYVRHMRYTSYKDAQRAVRWGEADVLLSSYYDNDPYASLEVLYPAYLSNPFVLVARKGMLPKVKDFAELSGKKGVIRREEMIWPLIQPSFPQDVHIEIVSGARNAFKKVLNGEVDFMLTSLYAAETEMRRFKILNDVEVSDTVLRNPNVFMAFSKVGGCRELHKDYFEKRIKELTSDKDYMKSLISEYVVTWEKKFRNEPSLMTEAGQKMDDETEIEEVPEDEMDDSKMKSLQELNPEVLIQQQMEKMKKAEQPVLD